MLFRSRSLLVAGACLSVGAGAPLEGSAQTQSACVPPLAADTYRQVRVNGGSVSEALQMARNLGYFDGSKSCSSAIRQIMQTDPMMYGSFSGDFQ